LDPDDKDILDKAHQPPPSAQKARHAFLSRLKTIAVLSAASILFLTGFGVWRVVSHYIILSAQRNSVNISLALSGSELESFFKVTPGGDRLVCEIPPDSLEAVDQRIRQFLSPFAIVKIKVYSTDTCIVYSTDPGIIGERDPDNRRLLNALSGKTVAKLVRKDSMEDLFREQRINVDVVETYVPIYEGDEVIGCFEVYMDVSSYRGAIRRIVFISVVVIGLIILAVYAIAYKLVDKTGRKLKTAQDMLELYAASDPLTDLYNRRHLFVRAQQELARLQREVTADATHPHMSVTMVDLDRFKTINDTHGHAVGDRVLKETARRILATTRPYDVVGRLGGEEFVIIHPDADYVEARGIARRIWSAIREEPYSIDGIKIRVSASLGVATLDPTVEKDFTAALDRADRAMYEAKRTGRDRVA